MVSNIITEDKNMHYELIWVKKLLTYFGVRQDGSNEPFCVSQKLLMYYR